MVSQITKLKILEIKRSNYGDIYGLINGRVKYQNANNTVDLGRSSNKFVYNVEKDIGLLRFKFPDRTFTLKAENFYSLTPEPTTSLLRLNLIKMGFFAKNHWRDGLSIGGILYTFLKEIGVFVYPIQKGFKY